MAKWNIPSPISSPPTKKALLRQEITKLRHERHKLEVEANIADAEIMRLKSNMAVLETQIATLEAFRPHWAQGHTDDSVASQVSIAALANIWELLKVDNQTDAMETIKILLRMDL